MQRITNARPFHPLWNTASTRALEQRLAAERPPATLMRRAGAAVARLALAFAPHSPRYWVWAGPGNNGGDGLEAARVLHLSGHAVGVTLAADAERLPPDARMALSRARDAGVTVQETGPDPSTGPAADTLWIDGLLGLGLRASAGKRGLSPALEQALKALRQHAGPVLSIDLPSGLDADTGAGQPWTVSARLTLSLLTLKPGLFTGHGREWAGEVWWDDLVSEWETPLGAGQPSATTPDAWLTSEAQATPRRHAQHKGSFGDVSVVGGAPGMTGAALLASSAAQAAGAGRVCLHLLDTAPSTDPVNPALMYRPLALDDPAWSQRTVVCGCGGGEAVAEALPSLLHQAARLVLDADGLNAIAASPALQRQLSQRSTRGRPTVLTPHPLEAARLLGVDTAEVQGNRLAAARRIAEDWGCVVVLKGSGSVIAAPGVPPHINLPGNAALANAGTGDVLAGWMGGWWAQSTSSATQASSPTLAEAHAVATQAVAMHGAAAEPARPGPLRAQELIERLHARLREPRDL